MNDTSNGASNEETNREYAGGIRKSKYPSGRQHKQVFGFDGLGDLGVKFGEQLGRKHQGVGG